MQNVRIAPYQIPIPGLLFDGLITFFINFFHKVVPYMKDHLNESRQGLIFINKITLLLFKD